MKRYVLNLYKIKKEKEKIKQIDIKFFFLIIIH